MSTKKYDFRLSRRLLAHLGILTGLTSMVCLTALLPACIGQKPWFATLLLAAALASGMVLVTGSILLFKKRSGTMFAVGCLGSASPWIWAVAECLFGAGSSPMPPLLFLAPVGLCMVMLAWLWATRT